MALRQLLGSQNRTDILDYVLPYDVLVIDEAQSLPHELLEEIRLLTNLQSPSGQSLTVVLVGQPELAGRLNEERLRQLKQRVALRCELTPLDIQETAAYIAARVQVAGGRPELLFMRDAVSAIHEHSRGIPRTISVICDNALVTGFAADVKPVGRDIVLEVCRDFQFSAPSPELGRTSTANGSRVRPAEATPPTPRPEGPESRPSKSLFSGFTRTKRFLIL